jgi:TetR/AcrR family transcriptional regulator, cholesterol catabolism regulator
VAEPGSRSSRQTKIRLEPFDGGSRFDRRLAELLAHATDVFFEKGYEGASMRDLSRATGMSLAGLYYYFQSKERLLYLIQKHTFETILAQLDQRLAVEDDPEQRVRTLIANHLEYFLANQKGMTVLAHEDEVLKGEFGGEIRDIKRKYYRTCRELVEGLNVERGLHINTRIAVLSLFGMMNWIYTWYRPQADSDAATLAREMGNIFLRGVLGVDVGKTKGQANGAGVSRAARVRKEFPTLAAPLRGSVEHGAPAFRSTDGNREEMRSSEWQRLPKRRKRHGN